MNDRPTPETDAETNYCDAMPDMPWVDAEVARKLERERDEAREEAEYWKEAAKVPSGIFRSLEMARDQAKRDAEYYRARYEKLKDEREAAK